MVYIDMYEGDCLEVMKDLSSNSIDCFICDLPYGCLSRSSIGKAAEEKKCFSGNSTGCQWDIKIDLNLFWEQVKRLCKNEHTPVIMFCNTKFGYELIKSNESWFRYDLVWDKEIGVNFLSSNKMPMKSHEMIYIFSKSGSFYNRIDEKGDFPKGGGGDRKNAKVYGTIGEKHITEAGRRCVKSIVTCKKTKMKNQHPTEKPLELYKWLIERYCPVGGTILDPTAGSFNCCLAAFELDRNSIGIEKDKTFFDLACKKVDDKNQSRTLGKGER